MGERMTINKDHLPVAEHRPFSRHHGHNNTRLTYAHLAGSSYMIKCICKGTILVTALYFVTRIHIIMIYMD